MQPQDPEQWRQPSEVSPQISYTPFVDQTSSAQPQPAVVLPETPEHSVPLPTTDENENENEILLRWQATEYIQHDRTVMWYVLFALVAFGLMAAAVFLIKSYTFAVLVPVMAVALLFYVRRQPAVLNYVLSKKGLYINDRLYPYNNFKAFGIVDFSGHHSALLIPRKRFQIGQSVYFPDEVGEVLVDMLAARLPMQEVKPDLYDRIITKLKM